MCTHVLTCLTHIPARYSSLIDSVIDDFSPPLISKGNESYYCIHCEDLYAFEMRVLTVRLQVLLNATVLPV